MWATALIMGQESLLEIFSEADICLFRVTVAPKYVNVKHARAPFRFAQLRKARFARTRNLPLPRPFAISVACHA